MKKISHNIKTIIGAGLLALALMGSIASVSQLNNSMNQVAMQDHVELQMEKSISVLP